MSRVLKNEQIEFWVELGRRRAKIRITHTFKKKTLGNQEQFDMLGPSILGTMGKNETGKAACGQIKRNV